ncbi:MAG: glycine--tRNA ligase subunit beta [Proteobacteria bacterium]|nr:glycine--tRNA ligase subunit beta [Pseudomonadota bacterium]MBU1708868.1 glycine--tRNA ligase subunit beta [Pseudomonadota bacterium]
MKNELVFEIGTEEIPAGFILPALNDLKTLLGKKLVTLSLAYETIDGAATPRRFALNVTGLSDKQPDRKEEILGPPKKAAFDADNNPTRAALGFAQSNNVDVKQLQVITTPKGEYVMLALEKNGKDAREILSTLLPEIIGEINFPKSMRWGTGTTSFARPIQWITAVYNGEIVPFTIERLTSGNTTRGHRFMAPEAFAVTDYAGYVDALRCAHVIVSPVERKKRVLAEITRAAETANGRILEDDELVDTVTNLVEEPNAICGSFDRKFLELPREVLITSMREHQKYFAVTDANGALLPHFIAVNNTKVKNATVAAEGHQRVLRARLEDAMFFFKADQHRTLADRVNDLSGIIFQAKLGTLYEKTQRLTRLAQKLAEKIAPDQIDLAIRAALLAKTDLLTSMVNEFPSLQGIMGKAYAILDKEPAEVATAIHEHYLPVRAGGELPTGIISALVGIADRIDTIAGCFGIGRTPTGTTDPFGLRRQALGLLNILEKHQISLSLDWLINEAFILYGDKLTENPDKAKQNIMQFIKGRYINDHVSRGVVPEALEAATSVSFDDPVDCSLRTRALADVSSEETFTILAGAFKRVVNIIKENQNTSVNQDLLTEAGEKALYTAFQKTKAKAEPLIAQQKYKEAMKEILSMKDPVDSFFDGVMVMVDDVELRENRLALLTSIAELFLKIGNFSKMYSVKS